MCYLENQSLSIEEQLDIGKFLSKEGPQISGSLSWGLPPPNVFQDSNATLHFKVA